MTGPTYAASTDVPAGPVACGDREGRAPLRRPPVHVRLGGGRPGSARRRAFVINDRQVRFLLPMPDAQAREFTHTPARGNRRSPAEAEKAYEQAVRSRWRSLGLVIRAKLEAVASGIVTFEDEFMAHLVLPEGDTVGQRMHPVLAQTFSEGRTPPSLLPPVAPLSIEGPR